MVASKASISKLAKRQGHVPLCGKASCRMCRVRWECERFPLITRLISFVTSPIPGGQYPLERPTANATGPENPGHKELCCYVYPDRWPIMVNSGENPSHASGSQDLAISPTMAAAQGGAGQGASGRVTGD